MPLWELFIIIGASTFAFIAIAYYTTITLVIFHITFTRRKGDEHFAENEDPRFKNAPDRVWYFSNKIEEIEMKSFDDLKLKGYFVSNSSNKLVIMTHGYHGRYYSLVSQARIFYEHGFDILNINNRCHDSSEGKYLTMGINEKKDLLDWINLMIKRNPNYEIVLFGISMGAFITLFTAADEKIPANVKCVIGDCGYNSIKKQIASSLKGLKIPFLSFVVFLLGIHAKLFHHFSINYSLQKELKTLSIPTLLVHGEDDSIVPFENLKANYDSIPQGVYKEMHGFVAADHTRCVQFKDKYEPIVIDFVNKFIK